MRKVVMTDFEKVHSMLEVVTRRRAFERYLLRYLWGKPQNNEETPRSRDIFDKRLDNRHMTLMDCKRPARKGM